jgi:hypothetical protein
LIPIALQSDKEVVDVAEVAGVVATAPVVVPVFVLDPLLPPHPATTTAPNIAIIQALCNIPRGSPSGPVLRPRQSEREDARQRSAARRLSPRRTAAPLAATVRVYTRHRLRL